MKPDKPKIDTTGAKPLPAPYNLPGGRTVTYHIDGHAVSATGIDLGPVPKDKAAPKPEPATTQKTTSTK